MDTSEVLCAPSGLEIGSHLLLGFEASDVSFGLVVSERNRLHEGEGEPSVLVFEQALEQVAAFGVFGFSSFALFGRRFLAVGYLADVLELPHPSLFVGDQYPGLLADFIQIEPELMHLHGPFRAIFDQIGQFPEQVCTTQGVTALLEIELERLTLVPHLATAFLYLGAR